MANLDNEGSGDFGGPSHEYPQQTRAFSVLSGALAFAGKVRHFSMRKNGAVDEMRRLGREAVDIAQEVIDEGAHIARNVGSVADSVQAKAMQAAATALFLVKDGAEATGAFADAITLDPERKMLGNIAYAIAGAAEQKADQWAYDGEVLQAKPKKEEIKKVKDRSVMIFNKERLLGHLLVSGNYAHAISESIFELSISLKIDISDPMQVRILAEGFREYVSEISSGKFTAVLLT